MQIISGKIRNVVENTSNISENIMLNSQNTSNDIENISNIVENSSNSVCVLSKVTKTSWGKGKFCRNFLQILTKYWTFKLKKH